MKADPAGADIGAPSRPTQLGVTIIGWSASHFSRIRSDFGASCAVVAAFLLLPGGLVPAGIAMIFSPQGVHGIGEYSWIMPPGSWLAYLLFLTAWNPPARFTAPK